MSRRIATNLRVRDYYKQKREMKIEAIEELKEKGEIDSDSGSKFVKIGHQYPNER